MSIVVNLNLCVQKYMECLFYYGFCVCYVQKLYLDVVQCEYYFKFIIVSQLVSVVLPQRLEITLSGFRTEQLSNNME